MFVVREQRATHPLLPLDIVRSRSVSAGTVLVVIGFLGLFGVLFFVTLYLQNVHGYSAVQTGVRLLPLTAVFGKSLGTTRARARMAFGRVTTRGRPNMDFFCPTNGTRLAVAQRRLHLTRYRVGLNDWYVAPDRRVRAVLKVHRGAVQEVGVANPSLTASRRPVAQPALVAADS